MPDHYGKGPGGKMPPQEHGRAPQVSGPTPRGSKRHDLEFRKVPLQHGSDLQYGDTQMLEQGIAEMRKQTQQPARPDVQQGAAAPPERLKGKAAPDPISFLSGKEAPSYPHSVPNSASLQNWQPIVRSVANAPQASSLLRSLFIRQYRNVSLNPNPEFYFLSLREMDMAAAQAIGYDDSQ